MTITNQSGKFSIEWETKPDNVSFDSMTEMKFNVTNNGEDSFSGQMVFEFPETGVTKGLDSHIYDPGIEKTVTQEFQDFQAEEIANGEPGTYNFDLILEGEWLRFNGPEPWSQVVATGSLSFGGDSGGGGGGGDGPSEDNVYISSISAGTTNATIGDMVAFDVFLLNENPEPVAATVETTVDGQVVDEWVPNVAGGGSREETIEIEMISDGQKEVCAEVVNIIG
jgi:hypothetical protein